MYKRQKRGEVYILFGGYNKEKGGLEMTIFYSLLSTEFSS
jgi:hypothetical protein